MELNYEELILLDNLIYLELDTEENEELMKIVDRLLANDRFEEIEACSIKMPKEEWRKVITQIRNKPNLMELRIRDIDNKYTKGIKSACFIDKKDNAIVIFRGSVTEDEWDDNGQGAYEYDTKEQIEALNYINNLEFNDIIVSGHSKGGNKAQYVAVLSDKINKCISVNGQGFSNEFTIKYKNQIEKNKSKIICINSKYDYVYCLFNQIGGEFHYIETDFKINSLDYHRANILLNENGNLNKETNQAIFPQVINHFSISLVSYLPKDTGNLIISAIISSIELILCKGETKDKILKAANEFLIMRCYENSDKYKQIYNKSFQVLKVLIAPLLFWEELINIEETNSKEFFDKFISELNLLRDGVIKNIEIIDTNEINLIKSISKEISSINLKLQSKYFG